MLALNVLYFDDADQTMLCFLRGLLREGGRLVAYVTERRTMEGWPFAQQGLHRLYDAEQLRVAFLAAGFAEDGVEVERVQISRGVTGLLVRAWK